MSRGPMTTCRMQVWSANTKRAGVPEGARLATASSTAVPGSVTQWMGPSGAVRAGSTKGMEAPALAAGGQLCDAPDGLAGWQTARIRLTGSVQLIVALVNLGCGGGPPTQSPRR